MGCLFDHERLDAYRVSIEFIAWTDPVLGSLAKEKRSSAAKHLEEDAGQGRFDDHEADRTSPRRNEHEYDPKTLSDRHWS